MRTFDKVTADSAGNLSVRFIEANGSFFRTTLAPGDDLTGMPQEVADMASAHWTPERIEAAKPEVPTSEQVQAGFIDLIQGRLDAFAKERGYDGILSACTYAADADPAFAAEGQRCVELRGKTWRAAYALLEAVAGRVPSIEEVIEAMPALEWPQ